MKNSCVYTASLILGLAEGAGCTVNHCEYYPAHCANLDDVGDVSSSDEETESESESESETGWFDLPSDTESAEDTTTGNEPECTMSSECAENEPICADGVCVPCSEHEQCPDSACNMATGECMPSDRVWWVDRSAGPGGDGTEAMPFDTVMAALGKIADGEQGVILIRKSADYGQIKIEQAADVAILGINLPVVSTGADALVIDGGARVFVAKMMIAGNHEGIVCMGSSVWLSDSLVLANEKHGIVANQCSTHVSRSRIINNDLGGIVATAGTLELTNAMVGGSVSDAPALHVDGATAALLYSTLCGGAFLSPALLCSGSYQVEVRNSLLMSEQALDEVAFCADASFQHSALEMDWGGDNVALGPMDTEWLVDYPLGDLHLSNLAPSEIATAAVWGLGDSKTDVDGDSRPAVDGAVDFAGADVVD